MENSSLSARAPLRQHSDKSYYSVDFLKSLSSSKCNRPLSPSLWRNLVILGISRLKPTRRGCRGGRKKSDLHSPTVAITQSNQEDMMNITIIERPHRRYLVKESIPKTRNQNNLRTIARSFDRYNRSNIRFALWNARSINNKTASLCDFIISRQLDIMALTETWLYGDDRDSHTLADISRTLGHYNILHIPRKNRHGGGIALISRNGLIITSNNHRSFKSMECLDVNVKSENKVIRLFLIYRPPPSSKNKLTTTMFFDEFNTLTEEIMAVSTSCLICGDFNIHMDSNNGEAIHFQETLHSAGLKQHVDFVTHSKGHTLDLIITNDDEMISSLFPLFDLPSDHASLACKLNIPRPPRVQVRRRHRKVYAIDVDNFIEDLKQVQFVTNPPSTLPTLVDSYNKELLSVLDRHAPLQDRTISIRPHAPWFSDNLRVLKKEKRRCERKWMKSNLEVDKQIYADYCKCYYTAIQRAKTEHFNKTVSNSNQKQLFQFVDSLLKVKHPPILPKHDSPFELAQRLNIYFSEKIQALRTELDSQPTRKLLVQVERRTSNAQMSSFDIVSSDVVMKAINSAPSKSCTLDPIPTDLLKKSLGALLPSVTSMVNKSLLTGVFPSQFKHALITPLLKKSDADREVLKNYRPISNLSFIGKIMERIVSAQLNHHLLVNDLYSTFQSAYRCHHSTETAMLRITNDINLALDNHDDVILVLLDLSSAFDTIDHTILIDRLQSKYGITATVLDWIKSYLTLRTHSTVINDTTSDAKMLAYGVPQGSVLGPLLFSLYVAPIEDVICAHGLQPMMYADDTQVYLVVKRSDPIPSLVKIENCVKDLISWMMNNKLVCNSSKTEVIHFSSRHLPSQPIQSITIDDNLIWTKSDVRDLGVRLDGHLTMDVQVKNICKSAALALRRVGTIRKYLDNRNAEKLIHAFVTSKIDYCNSLLYGLPDKYIGKLQRIQNSAARIVTRTTKSEHITPVLRDLHWLPVSKRIIFKLMLLTYKSVNHMAPKYLTDLLQAYKPGRALRSSTDHLRLKIPRFRTDSYGGRAFSVCAPELWNRIPLEVRESPSLDVFKSQLKTYLF